MNYQKPPVTKLTDKFLGYCAVTPNRKFMKLFERADVKNILISYHYIRKDKAITKEILEMVRARGGLFMTDSGIFSFFNDKNFDSNTFDWYGYLEEYIQWLDDNSEYIFSACNLDADLYVGHDKVVKWNENFFKPLEEKMNIIYVAHPNVMGLGELDAVKEYCKIHDYVAVNERFAKQASAIYQEAKITKTAIHGLAWTKPSILQDFPFFSVDSSSWVNYQKYGATPVWDGRNFTQYDKDNKHIRSTLRNQCIKYGIKEYEFVNEANEDDGEHNDDEGLTYSLRTWLDVFESIKRTARVKLTFDLKTMLEGKEVVFIEDKSGAQPAQPNRRSNIQAVLDEEDIESTEAIKTTYQVDEETGEEVALYQKREKKESIIAYRERAGDTMVCNYCHVSDKCPKFKQDATCAFDFSPASLTESPLAVIDHMITLQTERVQRAMFFEKMEGGMPNKVFASEMKLLQDLNNTKINMLMLVQNRGLRITTTTVEMGVEKALPDGTETPKKDEKPGFAQLLQNMLQKPG